MMRRSFILSALYFALFVTAASAQTVAAPEETDIVLPTRLLEIEDLQVEQIDAVLPDPPDIVPPELAFPLPTDTELTISDEAFQVPDLPSDVAAANAREASVYSTGSVGFGTMNEVSGALRLYKLGTDPRFNFTFTHDSLDGYDFRDAGTGFFRTENTIDGSVGASGETSNFESSASYEAVGEGLQGVSQYYSVETQFLSADVSLVHRPDPRVRLNADMSASSSRRLLTTVPDAEAAARLDREVTAAPSLGVALELSSVTAGVNLGYLYRGMRGLEALHAGTFEFDTDIAASDSLFFELGLGVFWVFGDRFEYPFNVGTSFSIRDRFTVGLSGGFEVDPILHSQLWDEIPLASVGVGGSLELPTRWFARTTVAWNLMPERLVVEGGVAYALNYHDVTVSGWNASASEFTLAQREIQDLTTRIEGRWSPAQGLTLSGGWLTRVLERRVIDPASSLETGVRYTSTDNVINIGASVAVPIYDGFVVPTLDIDGSVRVADGVDLVLEASDLLSPAVENGRAKYAGRVDESFPFIDPGFRVILKAQLSL